MTVRTGIGAWARSCALAQAGRAADRCSLLLHQAADAAQRAADRALDRPGPEVPGDYSDPWSRSADPVDEHMSQAASVLTFDRMGARVEDSITGIDGWLVRSSRLDGFALLGEDDTHFELWELARLAWLPEHQARMTLHPAGQQQLARHVGAMQDRMSARGLEIVRRTQ